MELKFNLVSERKFWAKTFRTLLQLRYGYDHAIKLADEATLEYRKRNN